MYSSFETTDEEKQPLKGGVSNMWASKASHAFPRLIERNRDFFQSNSKVKIENKLNGHRHIFPWSLKYIINDNWFHLMLRWPTIYSLMVLLILWVLWLVIFAWMYVYVDSRNPLTECGLGRSGEPIKFLPALSFSLETCTTVGYSLPNKTNGFFDSECYGIQFSIYLQMTWSMIFNAFFTAFIFARLSRCEQRSAQVLFSKQAIIEKKDGKWLFHVRVYDLDSQLPIVETHMRMYCASWMKYKEEKQGQPHILHSMRIFDPNDELNSWIFTGVPMTASHHIDAYSPLAPLDYRKDLNIMKGHGLMLREMDQISGNTGGWPCPVCGEVYETAEQLKTHIKFNKILEDADKNVPINGTHRDPSIVVPQLTEKKELTKEDIIETLKDKEIIVIVEGIEPMISGTFQCLHSYRLEDIVFESRFVPCIETENGKNFVNLDKFHEVKEIETVYRSEEEYKSFGECS